jgi:hypothetical protein
LQAERAINNKEEKSANNCYLSICYPFPANRENRTKLPDPYPHLMCRDKSAKEFCSILIKLYHTERERRRYELGVMDEESKNLSYGIIADNY